MTDVQGTPPQGTQPDPSTASNPRRCRGRRRGRRIFFVLFLVLIAVVVGVVTGHPFRHGWHGGWWAGDPAAIDRRIEKVVKRASVELDMNRAQEDKLIEIAKTAARDLRPMGDTMRNARWQVIELLRQPNLDRAAIEKFRTDQLAAADAFSQRLATAFGDATEALNPEQRRIAADHLSEMVRWRRSWQRD